MVGHRLRPAPDARRRRAPRPSRGAAAAARRPAVDPAAVRAPLVLRGTVQRHRPTGDQPADRADRGRAASACSSSRRSGARICCCAWRHSSRRLRRGAIAVRCCPETAWPPACLNHGCQATTRSSGHLTYRSVGRIRLARGFGSTTFVRLKAGYSLPVGRPLAPGAPPAQAPKKADSTSAAVAMIALGLLLGRTHGHTAQWLR